MNRYNAALEAANKLLNEADVKETDPRVQALLNQKKQIQTQIDRIDKTRKPLQLRLQQINTQLTNLGQEVSN